MIPGFAEKHCLNSLVDVRSNPSDPAEISDARSDVAVWLRYHFDNEQMFLIRQCVADALAGKAGR